MHPISVQTRLTIAYSLAGSYYYTLFCAASGAIIQTNHTIKQKGLVPIVVLSPISGAIDGVIIGWLHPIQFIKGVWNEVHSKD